MKTFTLQSTSIFCIRLISVVDYFDVYSDIFYVRNHLPVPMIDPETYELEVEIEGTNKKATYSLKQLKNLPKRSISATIMCAGNRRSEMTKVRNVESEVMSLVVCEFDLLAVVLVAALLCSKSNIS